MERLRARLLIERRRIDSLRASSGLVDTAFLLDERRRLVGGIVLAGALAFRFFLFLVPFVFVFFIGLGLFSEAASTGDPASLVGLKGVAATMADDVAANSTGVKVTALLAGLGSMLWAAFGLTTVLRTVHSLIWREPLRRQRHPWVGPLAVSATIVVLGAGARLLTVAREELGGVGLGLTLGAVAVVTASWTAISMVLPRAAGSTWRDVVPGGLVVGGGVQAIHLATVLYLAGRFSEMSDRYGALGAALGMLSWAYLIGSLVVYGAIVNAVLFERSGPREAVPMHHPGDEPGGDGQPERREPVQQDHADRVAG
jgi:uncharacterized BrkB/YihY/UPF0761 family membrane protein